MIVVADTSVLLNLCRIGEADLLWQLFGEVVTPKSVKDEFERAVNAYGRFAELEFPGFVRTHHLRQSLQTWLPSARLDLGESDAISLTMELKADLLLIDERKGRQVASQLGIRFSGILGVLVRAKQASLIPDAKALLLRLRREAGFFLSDQQLGHVLKMAGEQP